REVLGLGILREIDEHPSPARDVDVELAEDAGIISISFLRPWTMIEFERFSAMTSGGRSVTVAPAAPGAAAPGAGVGTTGTPGVPPARRRPPANSWLTMVATSPASAKLAGETCSP